jgi:HEAT repeat protein
MKQFTAFLACSIFLVSLAFAQKVQRYDMPESLTKYVQEYQGKNFSEWRDRTRPNFPTSERSEAIGNMTAIGVWRISSDKYRHQEDKGIAWVKEEIVPTLLTLLDDKDPEVRGCAANAFSHFPKKAETGKAAIPRLIELLRDPDDYVRRHAVGFFTFLGPAAEPAVPELVRVLKEDTLPDVRYSAARALRTTGLKAQQTLIAMLDDKSVEVRRAVAKSLYGNYVCDVPQEELQKSAPRLKELLHDDDAEVRRLAADALRFQNPQVRETVRELTQLLRDKDQKVRRAAAINFLETGRAAKPALPEILKLADDDDKPFRRYLTIYLSRVGPETIPALTKLLDDKDANVRAYAADGLGTFGVAAKEAVPALKRLLTDMDQVFDLQGCVCNHAGQALAKILGEKKYLEGLPAMPEDGK